MEKPPYHPSATAFDTDPATTACDLLATISEDFHELVREHCECCQGRSSRCVLRLIHEALAVGTC